jgi:deoxyribonuclease-4
VLKVKIGFHFSISGGIDRAVDRCLDLGCNSLQIFTGNPRSLFSEGLKEKEVELFRDKIGSNDIKLVVVHTNYLINLASKSRFRISFEAFYEECVKASKIGANYIVLHPGSLVDTEREEAIINIVYAINKVTSEIENCPTILLENTSGSGRQLGARFEDIVTIIDAVILKEKVGVCLDTAHAFQAGYSIHEKRSFLEFIEDFNSQGLLNKIRLVHLNDSKTPFASRVDRHWHLGVGYIGEFLGEIARFFASMDVPLVMETPWGLDEDRKNLATLLDWLGVKL